MDQEAKRFASQITFQITTILQSYLRFNCHGGLRTSAYEQVLYAMATGFLCNLFLKDFATT